MNMVFYYAAGAFLMGVGMVLGLLMAEVFFYRNEAEIKVKDLYDIKNDFVGDFATAMSHSRIKVLMKEIPTKKKSVKAKSKPLLETSGILEKSVNSL